MTRTHRSQPAPKRASQVCSTPTCDFSPHFFVATTIFPPAFFRPIPTHFLGFAYSLLCVVATHLSTRRTNLYAHCFRFLGTASTPAGFGYDPGDVGAPRAAGVEDTPARSQPRTPFYKTRKFIICQIITAILVIVLLFVLLFPVVRAIAQLVVNRSQLDIQKAQILSPQNDT